MNKKLQVFVSSTYTDLIEERQAAVEAILDAGHIPAGMELFKAGRSQMETIHKWIDDSDVYMLILGGRYGSIEEESGLSYTELEYRYALSKKMPVFAVVLSDSYLTMKISMQGLKETMEQIYPDKLIEFKSLVMTKIVRIVDDHKDIQISIHSTLNDFLYKYNLTGWERNNINDTICLDNTNYKINNNNFSNLNDNKLIGNYSFNELLCLFKNKYFISTEKLPTVNIRKGDKISALKLFISYYNSFTRGITFIQSLLGNEDNYLYLNVIPYFVNFDLIELVQTNMLGRGTYRISSNGSLFYTILEYNGFT